MTEKQIPQKPEWFEMAEADNAPAVHKVPSNRRVPFLALVATGAILTAGAVFANVNDEEHANAEDVAVQIQPNAAPIVGSQPLQQRPTQPRTQSQNDSQGGVAKPSQARPELGDDDQFGDGDRPQWRGEDGEDDEEHHAFPGGERPRHGDRHGVNPEGGTSGGAAGGIPSTGTGN